MKIKTFLNMINTNLIGQKLPKRTKLKINRGSEIIWTYQRKHKTVKF